MYLFLVVSTSTTVEVKMTEFTVSLCTGNTGIVCTSVSMAYI